MYQVGIYENELNYVGENVLKIDNVENFNGSNNLKLDNGLYLKNQIKYILFRYLPYFLKKYSKIEYVDFSKTIEQKEIAPFSPENLEFVNSLKTDTKVVDNKVFKFIHLMGSHVPFTHNKDLNEIKNGSYYDEVEACLTITKMYIDYLKENNVYNNSRIIIMADHGYCWKNDDTCIRKENGFTLDSFGRQNPILLVKGIKENHKKMQVSNVPVSYDDLMDVYMDLLDNKSSKELLKDIPKKRTRKTMMYVWLHENHMYEYETDGKAWENDKFIYTNNEYIRK
ncbi:MAG: sulfatase-like hydrolase/transferase [Bacilli bacterium]|nr:sulfatase-like hydrolase/transferase [Bacilli bacterium]